MAETATETAGVETLATQVAGALSELLKSSTSPEILQAQQLLLQRLALQGDVFSSRIPAPKNITEVGGYINLLGKLNQNETRTQALAAALGVAGPNPMPGLVPTAGVLFDVQRANDRPAGASQSSTPVQFRIRNDFASAFDLALDAIHAAGCMLPILSTPAILPALGANAASIDMLQALGRTLMLMPTAALVDPDTDPLALARIDGTTTLEVVARQLDNTAANAASVTEQSWIAWTCDATACTESTADRTYLSLTPILNAAGWYQSTPTAPQKLSQPGSWTRWTNTTGLIAGLSRFGDELNERFTPSQIAASALRDRLDWMWDGTDFVAPA